MRKHNEQLLNINRSTAGQRKPNSGEAVTELRPAKATKASDTVSDWL